MRVGGEVHDDVMGRDQLVHQGGVAHRALDHVDVADHRVEEERFAAYVMESSIVSPPGRTARARMTKLLPMKPAPPVTRTFMAARLSESWTKSAHRGQGD